MSPFLRVCLRFSYGFVYAAVASTTFFNVVGYPASITGVSMRPALNDFDYKRIEKHAFFNYLDLDWVFVNCWAARDFEFHRGEIVVLISPKDPYDKVIKRIVALEGDVIENSRYSPRVDIVVPEGGCWVEGDNRTNSVDSNSCYGPVSTGLIVGKATHIIWPPERWGRIPVTIPLSEYRRVEPIDSNRIKLINA